MKDKQFFMHVFKSLVNISTISSSNKEVDQSNKKFIDVLANYLSDFNFNIYIQKIPNSNDKFNLIASTHKIENTYSEGLMLSGHTDTVPCNENLWQFNPFELTRKKNRLYGLGTTDMKGFFAAMISLIRTLNIKNLKKPLYFLATADEETTMEGMKYFSNNNFGITPSLSIIGEPTSLEIIQSHKGYLCKQIQIQSRSAHSSNPYQEINTIEVMYEVIGCLMQLKQELQLKTNYKFNLPYSTMNFGCIQGGNAVNTICPLCTLQFDIRPIPIFSLAEIDVLLFKYLMPIEKKWKIKIKIVNLYDFIPGYDFKNLNLLKKLEYVLSKKSNYVDYCTEASFLNTVLPTIILGPGSIKQAHQSNEFFDIRYLDETYKIFLKLINYFCV
ncbi:Acetylornithine deacetylase [Buchnera aphidicola (Thelaxes suberi)]|uniref:acetylornithine deacetylase n=1 Tax=Buchnera aphidicola TaxID=9 RepID=UPI003463AD80